MSRLAFKYEVQTVKEEADGNGCKAVENRVIEGGNGIEYREHAAYKAQEGTSAQIHEAGELTFGAAELAVFFKMCEYSFLIPALFMQFLFQNFGIKLFHEPLLNQVHVNRSGV